ncbi:hypothetical protein [Kitasatospora cathayae]|uniref:Uncharacterized protein n=1 Tax=Kitasatospora cathayae TaxID=3004092 RepID=A0ABY7Q9Z4_9ACTN|nr:hypothetical protein [Kitasatospora sp. HUAS 3-15]WBP89476.1 hypothetical protein O1G21_28995 [Kitasatospora sp. HUAS 3-15]
MAEYSQAQEAALRRMAEHAAELPVRRPVPGEAALTAQWQDDHGDLDSWSEEIVLGYAAAVAQLRADAVREDRLRSVEPDGCGLCGIPRREHARRWVSPAGWHAWVQPSNDQILARMKARRAARATNSRKGGAR